ncbi:CoA transferase subunit A [Paenibacillus sinopodophylli]|uniref:CoA transferase subunit A n=1 Tax=Paenibacillus sinopodophylli TaxID=1837342 RepID=UPI00110C937A|nr:CoA-transferase [Paenibacillus sinopodophylli]
MTFISLKEAAKLIRDGEKLGISGHMDMSPMAIIRELIREGRKELHVIFAGAAAFNAELLIGTDVVKTIEFSQISLGEYGFAPQFRKRLEQAEIQTIEHACPTIAAGLQAGASGVPFMPVRGMIGTDYMRIRDDFHVIANPYDVKENIAIVPAIVPDTAIFHAYQADWNGNIITSSAHNNRLLAQASKQVIVSVEEIVAPQALRRDKGSFIPSAYVTSIVHAPNGALPTGCSGYYAIDDEHMRQYCSAVRQDEYQAYLQSYVFEGGEDSYAVQRR